MLIAVAGSRIFERNRTGWPMRLWWAQLTLNFLWSPIFSTVHEISVALGIILLLLAAILAFIGASRRRAMQRHVSQVRKHCEPGDPMCRPRQRQALLHRAYDNRVI
jgi:hypothetical protein